MSAAQRPDIIVVCDHGVEGGPKQFVQRFRWRDGVWIAKDTSGEKQSHLGGPVGPFATAEAVAEAPVGRWHLNTRCGTCRDKVPMEWDAGRINPSRGQVALTRLWAEAEALLKKLGMPTDTAQPLEFSLGKLRDTYASIPRLS